jgi:pimeloyl-ACP methyl ester carboxylesterase
MKIFFLIAILLILLPQDLLSREKWPTYAQDIKYKTSIDQSLQAMMIYKAKAQKKRPLLVALHSWSGNYRQTGWQNDALQWCHENDWNFIHPNFRGANSNPDACGSEKAVQDIIDAVKYIQNNSLVDSDRIYLIGSSGGGHAALLLAGRAPQIWAGVAAWVPISDLNAWWAQKNKQKSKYARNIEKVAGGKPDKDASAHEQCHLRSPLSYLHLAKKVNVDISAGISDGHKGGSVPFTHSLYAFNQVVPDKEKFPESIIEKSYRTQSLPASLKAPQADPLYGKKHLIYRQESLHARINIFQGGHEIIPHAALNWLKEQRKNKDAVWQSKHIHTLRSSQKNHPSGL